MRNRLFFCLIAWLGATSSLLAQVPAPTIEVVEIKLPAPPMPVTVEAKLPKFAPTPLPKADPPAPTALPVAPVAPTDLPPSVPPLKEFSLPSVKPIAPPAANVPAPAPVAPIEPLPAIPPIKEFSLPSAKPIAPPAAPEDPPVPVVPSEPALTPLPIKEFTVPNQKPAPGGEPKAQPLPTTAIENAKPLIDGPQPQFRRAANAAPKVKPRSTKDTATTTTYSAVPPQYPAVQDLANPDPLLPGTAAMVDVEVRTPCLAVRDTGPTRSWVRADYLLWWVKDAPLGISLVTTGNPNSNPGAELLNSDRAFDGFSGMRVGFGCWCDDDRKSGLDTSFFFLGRRSQDFFASSDSAGSPLLAFPFLSNAPGAVGSFVLPVSNPGFASGNVFVGSWLSLWGMEVNGAFTLYRQDNFEFSALVGVRYADLLENLSVTSVSADLTTNPTSVAILSDSFNTRNQFYGGQIAGRLNWHSETLSLDVTGKLALGSTHNVVDIQGVSSQFGPNLPNGVFPGGFFAQPTNSGRFTGNAFSVVPSLEMKLNWILSSHLRTFVGYDFLYWNQVVRPGSQVDRTINLTQSQVLGGTGTLIGPASPAPMFNRTDFWTHGVSFGLEVRF